MISLQPPILTVLRQVEMASRRHRAIWTRRELFPLFLNDHPILLKPASYYRSNTSDSYGSSGMTSGMTGSGRGQQQSGMNSWVFSPRYLFHLINPSMTLSTDHPIRMVRPLERIRALLEDSNRLECLAWIRSSFSPFYEFIVSLCSSFVSSYIVVMLPVSHAVWDLAQPLELKVNNPPWTRAFRFLFSFSLFFLFHANLLCHAISSSDSYGQSNTNDDSSYGNQSQQSGNQRQQSGGNTRRGDDSYQSGGQGEKWVVFSSFRLIIADRNSIAQLVR